MSTIQKSNYEISILSGAAELAQEAARRFAEMAEAYARHDKRFTVALSGGSTPKALFQILAEQPYAGEIPWRSIYFFWGDERCVPPDHAESNYRMANETLLSRV